MSEPSGPPVHRMRFQRKKYITAGAEKTHAFSAVMRLAMTSGEAAANLVREYLRLETEQHRQVSSMLRAMQPAQASDAEQLALPFGAATATKPEQMPPPMAGRVARFLNRADERKAALFDGIMEAVSQGGEDALKALRDLLRYETRQHKAAKMMLQLLDARSSRSMPTRVLGLIEGKPDKLWSLSQLVEHIRAEIGGEPEAIQNSVRQALFVLVHQRQIRQVDRAIYCSLNRRAKNADE